jgi:hypothetical protein
MWYIYTVTINNMEKQADTITNFSVEKETHKASFIHIPYAYGTKQLKMWVPKSVLSKNTGVPVWIIKNHLSEFNAKSRTGRYNIESVLETAGKTEADKPQPEAVVTVIDFTVDRDAIRQLIAEANELQPNTEAHIQAIGVIKHLSRLDEYKCIRIRHPYYITKYQSITPATVEQFQAQIDYIASRFNIRIPLVTFPKVVPASKASEYIDTTLLKQVVIREFKRAPWDNNESKWLNMPAY